MQKWAGMLVETSKAFGDPSVMTKQTRGDSDSRDLVLKNTFGRNKASQIDNTRLITF